MALGEWGHEGVIRIPLGRRSLAAHFQITDAVVCAFDGDGAASAGQLRFFTFGGGNYNIAEADLDGDGTANLQIFVNLTSEMFEADFIL